jgi:hypothetical protein
MANPLRRATDCDLIGAADAGKPPGVICPDDPSSWTEELPATEAGETVWTGEGVGGKGGGLITPSPGPRGGCSRC